LVNAALRSNISRILRMSMGNSLDVSKNRERAGPKRGLVWGLKQVEKFSPCRPSSSIKREKR